MGVVALALAATLLAALTFAAPAGASKGVVGSLTGLSPRAVDVNNTGAGGVAPGTLYIIETSRRRVNVFTPTNQFDRTWGFGVNSTIAGTGFEICTAESGNSCGNGSTSTGLGGFNEPPGIAVDQSDGSVYVTDRNQLRVTKFTATGTPLLTFGKGVNTTQAGTGFEICTAASGDTCGTGTTGDLGGEFATISESARMHVAVVPSSAPTAGNVVVTDPGNRRIQEFDSFGNFVRAFGWDVIANGQPGNEAQNEIQAVTIPATSGKFRLTLGGQTTGELPFNLPPSGGVGPLGSIQNALEALSSVGAGNVVVSGGPGNATGSAPYNVEFVGAKKDQELEGMTVNGTGLGAAPGKTVTCSGPTLASGSGGVPSSPISTTEYQWLRNGSPIPGATSQSYQITAADEGAAVQCQTTPFAEVNNHASTQASIPVTNVSPLPTTPRPVPPATLPLPTGTFGPGQSRAVGADGGYKLNCATGTWQNSPTSFSFQWYRNGIPLSGHGAGTDTYTVQTVDIATPAYFQCAVTASNAGGGVTKMTELGSTLGSDVSTSPLPNPRVGPTSTVTDIASVATLAEGANFEVCILASACKIAGPLFVQGPGRFGTNGLTQIEADSTGSIYALASNVQEFTPQGGPTALAPSFFGATPGVPNGVTAQTGGPIAIGVGPEGKILALQQYLTGATSECPSGNPSGGEIRVQEISNDGLTLLQTHGDCGGIGVSSSSTGGNVAFSEANGNIYFSNNGAGQVYILNNATPPSAQVDTVTPTTTTLIVNGTVNPNPTPGYPNPPSSDWHVEYKLHSESSWNRFGNQNVGAGTSDVPVKITIAGLLPSSEYDVRLVVTKKFDSAQDISTPVTVTTVADSPSLEGVRTTRVAESSARLHATINPQGSSTSYHFEYGKTPSYGNSTPSIDIGDGHDGVAVFADITDLDDEVYHFRVVAENDAGTTRSDNQTFVFHPQVCPNQAVRQQTQANYLPDCRGYEITTPEYHGGVMIWAFRGPVATEATSPARFGYNAVFGSIPDSGDVDPPNSGSDTYVATRTDDGWKSRYVGLSGSETHSMAIGALADPSLERIAIWNYPNGNTNPVGNAPYIWDPMGNLQERWPTNLGSIANGENFQGSTVPSEDLSHFVFKSNIPFTEDGPPSAIYDNDIESGTIDVVSRTDTADTEGTGDLSAATGNGDLSAATGTGTTVDGSNEVTALVASSGAFAIGQTITISGSTLAAGTTITACSPACAAPTTLTLSNPVTAGGGINKTLSASSPIVSNVVTTAGAFAVGQTITGPGIPSSTKIVAVDGSALTLDKAPTSSSTASSFSAGSPIVSNVVTTAGAFAVGQTITGTGIPYNTKITAVGTDTLTLDKTVTADGDDTSLLAVSYIASPVIMSVSRNGSHIVVGPEPSLVECLLSKICGTTMYMRTGGTGYSISKGHLAEFAGMTRDGSTVYFITDKQVTADDTDTSKDLFMWTEATDSVTRISSGGGVGNTDSCDAVESWTPKCNVGLIADYSITSQYFFTGYNGSTGGKGGNPRFDSFLAAESGDIYFRSPEQLDGPENGIEGAVNLYVFRDGSPQFVTVLNPKPVCQYLFTVQGGIQSTFCSTNSIGRMQVTPDGRYAAFLSQSKLTAYDNKGQTMMYRYDAVNDMMVCASCLPNGEPPNTHIRQVTRGSFNGLYITDDGRVFFNSPEQLAPQDTNGVYDVYEYVDGRAQLISQGTGAAAKVVCDACGLSAFAQPGLIGVSANGTDVFFATYDVLTPQDRNGANLKVYDARTNGGFPAPPDPPGCAAADECHGPSTLPLPPIQSGTGALLGNAGNAAAGNKAKQGTKRKSKKQLRKAKKTRAAKRKRNQAARKRSQARKAGRGHG